MAAWHSIADIGRWWVEELRDLAAMRSGMLVRSEAPPEWRIVLSREGVAVTSVIDGETTSIAGENGLAALSTFDWRVKGRSRPRAEIVLGEGRFLDRPLATLRLPRSRARAMARLDLETATPLDLETLLVMFPRRDCEAEGERYVVARRDHVVPVLRALETAGVTLAAISGEGARGPFRIPPGEVERAAGIRPPLRRRFTPLRLAAALLALGLPATLADAHWRLSEASATLDAAITAIAPEARSATALVEERNARLRLAEQVRVGLSNAVPVSRVLEELTVVLPDTVWVDTLGIERDVARITGFGTSTSSLIATLDASPLFAAPVFAAPVTKTVGGGDERFTIEMKVRRP